MPSIVIPRKKRSIKHIFLLFGIVKNALSMPSQIGSDAIKQMDGVPVLGRGYSITTNSFQASCIDVEKTETKESYNFDCE